MQQETMNCTNPELPCESVQKDHSRHDCDCRWCVFNREFNAAHGKTRGIETDEPAQS